MKANKRIVTGVAAAALVLGAGAGLADAAHSSSSGRASAGGPAGPGPGPGGAAIADYLGLTAAELRTQLEGGKTLADLATAQGKTVSGLEDAIVADAKTHLDAAVAAGQLTAAQEATQLSNLSAHVADFVNHTGPPAGGRGGGPFDVSAITAYLGISADALRTQLQAGTTLAAVATSQGKTVSGLEAAIVASAKTHLDAAVAAGKLTADQETTRLSNLSAHVADLVNQTGPPAGARGPGAGPPPAA